MLLEKHISDMEEFQFPIINERIIPPTRSSMDRTSTSVTTALTALYPNLLAALAGVGLPPSPEIKGHFSVACILQCIHRFTPHRQLTFHTSPALIDRKKRSGSSKRHDLTNDVNLAM